VGALRRNARRVRAGGADPLKLSSPCVTGFKLADKDRYVQALKFFGQGTLRFGDACACATALAAGGGCLMSFDRRLSVCLESSASRRSADLRSRVSRASARETRDQ
jgi:predicted nucleic acid-binding protein